MTARIFSLICTMIIAVCLSTPLLGCGASEKQIRDISGGICQVVVQALDPKLAPLCTTAEELEQVVSALIKGHGAGVGLSTYRPTQDEIYHALQLKRAAGDTKGVDARPAP